MKRCKWYSSLSMGLIFVLASLVVACAPPSPAVEQAPPEDEEVVKGPAEFKMGLLEVTPSVVMVGAPATVSTTVTNHGDMSGTYTAILYIDGQEADRELVSVEPKASREVSFELTITKAGSHQLAVGERNVAVTVCDWQPYTIQNEHGEMGPSAATAMYGSGDTGQIVGFSPPASPFKIQAIRICVATRVQNQSELDKRQVTFRIWDKDRIELVWSQDFPWRMFGGMLSWREVKVPDILVYDRFYVEIVTHSDQGDWAPNYVGLAYEPVKPPSTYLSEEFRQAYISSGGGTGSGWSLNGQYLQAPSKASGIIWRVRVLGQGP